jgi:hypothetical protein
MSRHRYGAASGLLLLLSSCSSDGSAPPDHHGPAGEQDLSNVIYVGAVNDEALERMLDAPLKNDPRRTVVVDSPDLSLPVPPDTAPTLRFHLESEEATRRPGLQLEPPRTQPSKWQRSFRELVRFLSPERVAHAHGAPYNGTAYYIVISDAHSKPKLQAFTPETSFTPEAVDWQNLVQAQQPLTLTITSALFVESAVPAEGGPFDGGSFPFRIE